MLLYQLASDTTGLVSKAVTVQVGSLSDALSTCLRRPGQEALVAHSVGDVPETLATVQAMPATFAPE